MNGVFAAKKTVGGITYVIACNMSTTEAVNPVNPHYPGTWTEHPIPKATIDVGFTIKSANKIFEAGAISFSGSSITDSYPPMGVHIYAVR